MNFIACRSTVAHFRVNRQKHFLEAVKRSHSVSKHNVVVSLRGIKQNPCAGTIRHVGYVGHVVITEFYVFNAGIESVTIFIIRFITEIEFESIPSYINKIRADYINSQKVESSRNLTSVILDAGFNHPSSYYRFLRKKQKIEDE